MKNYIHNLNNEIVAAIFVSTGILVETNIPRISTCALLASWFNMAPLSLLKVPEQVKTLESAVEIKVFGLEHHVLRLIDRVACIEQNCLVCNK